VQRIFIVDLEAAAKTGSFCSVLLPHSGGDIIKKNGKNV